MVNRTWPLFGLRVTTPRLELSAAADSDIDEMVELAAAGIHDPDVNPFLGSWTYLESPDFERGIAQWIWRCRAEWKPESWNLCLVVRRGGRIIGVQDVGARNFAELGEVSTGSWLGREFQGKGYGKEMRAAVLALAFEGLGATTAVSGARQENAASLAVSRSLGYRDNGTQRVLMGDQPATEIRLLLDRETWAERRTRPPYPDRVGPRGPLSGPRAGPTPRWRTGVAVEIEGLEPCLDLFGLRQPGQLNRFIAVPETVRSYSRDDRSPLRIRTRGRARSPRQP